MMTSWLLAMERAELDAKALLTGEMLLLILSVC
jgi:hypothetical protein